MIFLFVSFIAAQSNGNCPAIIAYKVTPRHQTSTSYEWYFCLLASSGAVYEGDPQKVELKLPSSSFITNPKSTSLAFQLWSNMMFSHLISRWKILCDFMYLRADKIYLKIFIANFSERGPLRLM